MRTEPIKSCVKKPVLIFFACLQFFFLFCFPLFFFSFKFPARKNVIKKETQRASQTDGCLSLVCVLLSAPATERASAATVNAFVKKEMRPSLCAAVR